MSSIAVPIRRRAAKLAFAFLVLVTAALPETLALAEASAAHDATLPASTSTADGGHGALAQSVPLVNGEFRLRHVRPLSLRSGAAMRAVAQSVRGRGPCSAADICSDTIFQDGFEPPCVALP